jgi:hypothetical protein
MKKKCIPLSSRGKRYESRIAPSIKLAGKRAENRGDVAD